MYEHRQTGDKKKEKLTAPDVFLAGALPLRQSKDLLSLSGCVGSCVHFDVQVRFYQSSEFLLQKQRFSVTKDYTEASAKLPCASKKKKAKQNKTETEEAGCVFSLHCFLPQ